MTLEALSQYLLRNRKAGDVRGAELYRKEVALAELQDLIFVNDTRAYLEYSIEGRRGMAYIKEHWAEIIAELESGIGKGTKNGRQSSTDSHRGE